MAGGTRQAPHDQLAAGRKTRHQWPHRPTTCGGCENRSGPAHTVERRWGIVDGSIDVHVRAQIFRKLFLLAPTSNGDSMESHVPGKPHTKMSKSANALHRDQISAAQAGVAKSVVGRDTGSQGRGGFCLTELVRNGSDAACFSDHHFRVST